MDEKRVIELASKGLTVQEIAAFENVSHDTITRRFAPAVERGRFLCDGQIRAKQVELAMKGNPIMLIWLGKNRLSQADKQEIDVHRQTTVRMVVGIEQNDLNSLTNGYFEQNPRDNPRELVENTPIEVCSAPQKDESPVTESLNP